MRSSRKKRTRIISKCWWAYRRICAYLNMRISEGIKLSDDIREANESEIQGREPTLLTHKILRRYVREEKRKDAAYICNQLQQQEDVGVDQMHFKEYIYSFPVNKETKAKRKGLLKRRHEKSHDSYIFHCVMRRVQQIHLEGAVHTTGSASGIFFLTIMKNAAFYYVAFEIEKYD